MASASAALLQLCRPSARLREHASCRLSSETPPDAVHLRGAPAPGELLALAPAAQTGGAAALLSTLKPRCTGESVAALWLVPPVLPEAGGVWAAAAMG
jgi:hypothetical protein